jgi:hypothetical protein
MTSKKKTSKRRKLFIIYDDYYNCVLPFFFLWFCEEINEMSFLGAGGSPEKRNVINIMLALYLFS